MTRLYDELADWYDLLTVPESYVEEAAIFTGLIGEHAAAEVRSVLELGCGSGCNASHMKSHFDLTLTDLSPRMLDLSRRRNPECEHVEGDMRTLRLHRGFDAVFVHDAVAYITTRDDLAAVFATAYEHLRPGGVALFVPDDIAESYRPTTDHGGHDGDGRSMRYLQWQHPATGEVALTTFVYVLRDGDQERVEVDHHTTGVFPRAAWLDGIQAAGFEATAVPYRHSSFAPDAGNEIFLGKRS